MASRYELGSIHSSSILWKCLWKIIISLFIQGYLNFQASLMALEKEMATHSSILAWRIPWMEEPCRLQSMELQRVRHNWVTNTHTHTHTHSSAGKESACNVGNPGSIPGLGRSPGEGIRPTLVCFIASFSFLLFSLCYKLRV